MKVTANHHKPGFKSKSITIKVQAAKVLEALLKLDVGATIFNGTTDKENQTIIKPLILDIQKSLKIVTTQQPLK